MYQSSIFQTNIPSNSPESEKAISFDNCQVKISNDILLIIDNNEVLLNSSLTLFEEDFSTISFKGRYSNGIEFRIIRPTSNSLKSLKSRYDCETAFSIASLDPSGYAVHFILTNSNQKPNIEKRCCTFLQQRNQSCNPR